MEAPSGMVGHDARRPWKVSLRSEPNDPEPCRRRRRVGRVLYQPHRSSRKNRSILAHLADPRQRVRAAHRGESRAGGLAHVLRTWRRERRSPDTAGCDSVPGQPREIAHKLDPSIRNLADRKRTTEDKGPNDGSFVPL